MSWYNDSWSFRAPIAVYNSGATGAKDITAALPAQWDHIFANSLASGNDIRVTLADGVTLATYDLNGFNATTKAGTIEVQAATCTGTTAYTIGGTTLFWLYYGNAAATDARTNFVPAGALTGIVSNDIPPRQWVAHAAMERAGGHRPSQEFAKKSYEEVDLYFLVSPYLQTRGQTSAGRLRLEEVASATPIGVVSEADTAAIYDASMTRFVEAPDGRFYVVIRVKAGTGSTPTDYTVGAKMITTATNARKLQARALLRVADTNEVL